MSTKDYIMETNENVLKAINFSFSEELDLGQFVISSNQFYEGLFARRVIMYFKTKILGQENIQKYEVSIEMPKNWWNHFKKDCLPFLNVKTKTIKKVITFNHIALMPKINYKPNEDKIIMYSEKIKEE